MKEKDENIKNFVSTWESIANSRKHSYFNISLLRHIYPALIYVNDYKNQLFYRLPSGVEYLKHLLWGFLWTIKWFMLRPKFKKSNFIVLALGSNRNLTLNYVNSLKNIIANNKTIIVSLNVLCFGSLLKNSNIFYLPRINYQSFTKKHKQNRKEIFQILHTDLIKQIAKHNILMNHGGTLEKYYNSYYNDYTAFDSFVKSILFGKVLCLIQDFDNNTNKILYQIIARRNNIKTIVVDHSVNIHPFLGNSRYSDFVLCWGNYSYNKAKLIDEDRTKQKIIIGSPKRFEWKKRNSTESNNILYIGSPLKNPAFPLPGRSIDLSLSYLEALNQLCAKGIAEKIFFKPHPDDGNEFWKKKIPSVNNLFFSSGKSVFELLNSVSFVVIEDSTVILDLISYDIPLIYLADEEQNDHWGIRNDANIYFCEKPEDLIEIIKSVEFNNINIEERKRFFNMYIEAKLDFENQLKEFFDTKIFEKIK